MTDVSLTQRPDEGQTRRGLYYPLGTWNPAPGDLHEVAAGIFWLRIPMPFSLDHINLWVLDGGDHWVLVDTAIPASECKEIWRGVLAKLQAEKPVGRLICTHYHPDHLGLAGWLCRKTGAEFLMTRTEYLTARMLLADQRDAPPDAAIRFSERAGYSPAQLAQMRAEGWGRFARAIYPLPDEFTRLMDGDELVIGARTWRIVTGSGHTPEHACLVDETGLDGDGLHGDGPGGAGGVMIAGDQVLPRITSNVSVHMTEPMANPLQDWLSSIEKLRGLPDSLYVLPAHGFPFHGLHERLDQLDKDHRHKLEMLRHYLAERPRTATETFDVLFGRAIDEREVGMAVGEALAHLRWLEAEGQARRAVEDGAADQWSA